MKVEELMDEFAKDVGIAGFEPDGDGVYGCEIDGVEVYLCGTDDERLVIWGDLCDPVWNGKAELYQLLLESSFLGSATAGGSFALNPESGQVSFQRFETLELMTSARLKDRLEGFVWLFKKWKDLVDSYGGSLMELENADDGERKNAHDDLAGRSLQV